MEDREEERLSQRPRKQNSSEQQKTGKDKGVENRKEKLKGVRGKRIRQGIRTSTKSRASSGH